MNNDSNIHAEPLKSVNAVRRPELQRNKSVVCREKQGIANSTSWVQPKPNEAPLHSERNSLHQQQQHPYYPIINPRDLRDVNVQLQKLVRMPKAESEWDQAVLRFKRWAPSSHTFGEMSALF